MSNGSGEVERSRGLSTCSASIRCPPPTPPNLIPVPNGEECGGGRGRWRMLVR